MKKQFLFSAILICLCLVNTTALGQTSSSTESVVPTKVFLDELFRSGKTFETIVEEADQHFKNKYPDLTFPELCTGEHRDGAFVKYQRWQAFWRNNLNEDGTLGDFTLAKREEIRTRGDRDATCDDSNVIAEWDNINYDSNMGLQIDQGRTSSIAFHPTDPDTYYIGAAWGGLWKTTDGGNTNFLVNDDLPLAAVSGILIDPDNPNHLVVTLSDIVWYGPAGIGVYVSEDGGTTFEASSTTWELTESNRIYYISQDPTDAETMIIATSDGLFKSTDFFETNTLVQSGDMRSVKFSQSNPDIVYAGGSSGEFYKSTDGGDSFDLAEDFGGGHVRIAVSIVDGSGRVVATHNSQIQTSTNNGETFTTHSLPESNMVVEFASGSDEVLNVGNFEVHQSDDFGASFNPVTHWLGDDGLPFIHVDQRNVFVNPLDPGHVYFCNDGGIFRHNVLTNDFDNLSDGLIITQYYDIAVSQSVDNVLGGGSQDNGNVFRSSDGEWWRYAQTGDGMGQDIDPVNPDTRYWSYQYGGLRRWIDGDNDNIQPEDESGAWETPFKLDPNNNNRILVGYNSVYQSNDNGDTWTTLGDVVSPASDLQQLAIAPSNSDKVYASQGRVLYVKEPDSDEWESITTPVFAEITDLEVDPFDEDVVYICYNGFIPGKKVYKSEDAGENWTNITGDLPNLPFMSLELYHEEPGGVLVGTYGAVYYADNLHPEWRKFGCLPNTSVNDIEIQYHTNRVFIGTHGRGMFVAPLTLYTVSLEEEIQAEPTDLVLYPNPATNAVLIKSGSIDLSQANVAVTDATGRTVTVDYMVNSAGEIELRCGHLVAGNYFISVYDEVGNNTILKLAKR